MPGKRQEIGIVEPKGTKRTFDEDLDDSNEGAPEASSSAIQRQDRDEDEDEDEDDPESDDEAPDAVGLNEVKENEDREAQQVEL